MKCVKRGERGGRGGDDGEKNTERECVYVCVWEREKMCGFSFYDLSPLTPGGPSKIFRRKRENLRTHTERETEINTPPVTFPYLLKQYTNRITHARISTSLYIYSSMHPFIHRIIHTRLHTFYARTLSYKFGYFALAIYTHTHTHMKENCYKK